MAEKPGERCEDALFLGKQQYVVVTNKVRDGWSVTFLPRDTDIGSLRAEEDIFIPDDRDKDAAQREATEKSTLDRRIGYGGSIYWMRRVDEGEMWRVEVASDTGGPQTLFTYPKDECSEREALALSRRELTGG